jgi:excisionase family DNA binding protein
VTTPAKLAERWKCSERHVRNLIASREIESFLLGGRLVRIRKEAIELYEEKQAQHAQPAGEQSSTVRTSDPKTTRRKPAKRLDLHRF